MNYIYGKEALTVTQILHILSRVLNELAPKTGQLPSTKSLEDSENESDLVVAAGSIKSLPMVRALYQVLRYYPDTRRPNINPVKAPEYLVQTSKLQMYSLDYKPIELPKPVRRSKEILRYAPINIKTSRPRTAFLLGSFYVDGLDYQLLNRLVISPDFRMAAGFVVSQSDMSKVMRWSYRYSTLHRKTVMNSHKLTSAKKLLGPGFFDSTATKGNI